MVKPEHNITNPAVERAFEVKAEQEFRGQRELPNGRSYLWNYYHAKTRAELEAYRKNFDKAFPRSPGAGL